MDQVKSDKDQKFLEWLVANGAKFPKIDWPRSDTDSGIRGAIALDDIETDEYMLEIPYPLMMAPPQILSHPELGPVLEACKDHLFGDFLVTIFLMHELRLKEKSFYYPYINILPEPTCISGWNDHELLELQDDKLYIKAKNRQIFLQNHHRHILLALHTRAPKLFPLEDFPLASFAFAFNTIQARAFGRRLPWTALVPFADCLNHANKQTKYLFDTVNPVDPQEDEVFRLYPSGENAYAKGKEVFNSYGRRANDNLLMDYGFAMRENQWEQVEVHFHFGLPASFTAAASSLSATSSATSSSSTNKAALDLDNNEYDSDAYSVRKEALYTVGFNSLEVILFSEYAIPMQALAFARIVTSSHDELRMILAENNLQQSTVLGWQPLQLTQQQAASQLDDQTAPKKEDGGGHGHAYNSFLDRRLRYANTIFQGILSKHNELTALAYIRSQLQCKLGSYATSIEEDEALLVKLARHQQQQQQLISRQQLASLRGRPADDAGSQAEARMVNETVFDLDEIQQLQQEQQQREMQEYHVEYVSNAIVYRLGKKEILRKVVKMIDQLIRYLAAKKDEKDADDSSFERYREQLIERCQESLSSTAQEKFRSYLMSLDQFR